MEKILEKTLLFDFYGELLTAHQQEIYENVVFNDMSLSEAAGEYGVSRQGIHDMIRRCDRALEEYEEKLGLVGQYERMKRTAERMKAVLDDPSRPELAGETGAELRTLTEKLLEELEHE